MCNKSVLAVIAHPDDGSLATGGTLARYGAEGATVTVPFATQDTVSISNALSPDIQEDRGHLGQKNLRCACKSMGISPPLFLRYHDSAKTGANGKIHPAALCESSPGPIISAIVRAIRRFKPQVVLTVGSNTGQDQPDHTLIRQLTTDAFHKAGDATSHRWHRIEGYSPWHPMALYYAVIPDASREAIRELTSEREDEHADTLCGSPSNPITTEIDVRQYLLKKQTAIRCGNRNLSTENQTNVLSEDIYGTEFYVRAYPPVTPGETNAEDLFSIITSAT